jgi:hypothetical protein
MCSARNPFDTFLAHGECVIRVGLCPVISQVVAKPNSPSTEWIRELRPSLGPLSLNGTLIERRSPIV